MTDHFTETELSEIKEINKLCYPVGAIVLQWSYVDLTLDSTIKIISKYYDTMDLVNIKSMSKLAGNKIKLIELCLNQLPSLTIFKKDGLNIMENASVICNKRNDIIHSTYDGINPNGSYNFKRLVVVKKTHRFIIYKDIYTIPTLIELQKKIQDLARDIGLFGSRLGSKDEP